MLKYRRLVRLGRGWPIRIKSNETALVVPACTREESIDIARRIAQGYGRIDISQATGGAGFDFTVSQALA
ncbi:MAG: hypothetical protein WCG27_13510, partial [Pseudomonadota bacterium]